MGKGYVIRVENTDIVALSSEEEARAVISDLRTNYINSIVQSGMVTVEEIFIKENIEIVEKDVPVSIFRNKEEAVQLLTRGTDKTLNYVVRRGDCLWTIAQDNKMTVDDLRKANPEVKGDFLLEGQNLNLILPDPYVTIESKELVVYTVNIPYSLEVVEDPDMWPWEEKVLQYGQNGIKEITDQVIKENGKEISRIRVNEKIQKYPVTKRISRGTKQVPQMGSGDMVWPVQGQVTSYFGMRWGSMHNGIDIAANRGTPVLAADSGMVSFAGWNGGYGYLVKIDHGGGKETRYAHLSVPPVSVGQKVEKGDVIGYVDSTGNSSGPHLHFEVRANGVAKNPLDFYQ